MLNFRKYFNYLLTAPLTIALLGLYWLIFILLIASFSLSQNPEHSPYLVQWGASVQALTFGNEPWRIGTAALLTGNVFQLLAFSFALALSGFFAEHRLGAWRMMLVFALGASAGILMATIYSENNIVLGGVGGIAAWIGYGVAHYRLRLPVASKNQQIEQLVQSHTNRVFLIIATISSLSLLVVFDSAIFIGGLLASFFLFSINAIAVRVPDRNIANMLLDIGAVMLCGIMATITSYQYKTERNVNLRSQQFLAALERNSALNDGFNQQRQDCILGGSGSSANALFIDSVNCLAQRNQLTDTKLNQQQKQSIIKQQPNWLICSHRAKQLTDQSLDKQIKQLGNLAHDYCYSRASIDALFVADDLNQFYPAVASEEQLANMRKFAQLYFRPSDSSAAALAQLLQLWRQPDQIYPQLKEIMTLDANCLFFCSTQRKLAALSQN